MAQRRMFSLQIVDTDAFLDMPQGAQLLYFQLAMRGDDDGFVNNPKKIMRIIGSNDDDMKILLTKRFILSFESGIVVIKHWRIHNYIQKDRYNETNYLREKSQLQVKKNGSYTECIQDVSTLDTQVRLGKVRDKEVEQAQHSPSLEEEIVPTDNEGNEIEQKPKTKRNQEALGVQKYYSLQAQKITKVKTEYGNGFAGYTILCKVLKDNPKEDVRKMLDYYLDSKKFDEFPMLTAALSQDSIRLYKEDA